jgi:integrase
VIGHREINAYKQARLSEGAKPATVNNELSVVRRSLSLAREELQRVVKIEKLPTHNKRTGTVSEEAYRFLVKVLPDWAQGPFIFSYFTGVRQGELLELRWSWYDADSDTFKPGTSAGTPPQGNDAKCGFACHTRAKAKDYVFTEYGKR